MIGEQRSEDGDVPSGGDRRPAVFRDPTGRSNEIYRNMFLPILLDRVSLMTRRALADCMRERGLTAVHASYLIALTLNDGLTLVELSRFLDMDSANTNRVVKTLREQGLVYDDRATPKSKKFSVYLTDEGRALVDQMSVRMRAYMLDMFEGVPKFSIDNMGFTLIKMIFNSDPGFREFVDSEWIEPYFSYMTDGVRPEGEEGEETAPENPRDR